MSEKIMLVLKFIFAALLIPLVIGTVMALRAEISRLDMLSQAAIYTGTLVYVLMKFFVYDLDAVYKFGQGIVGFCFQFLKPMMNFAPYVIPVYTILGIIAYAVFHATGALEGREPLGLVLIGAIAFTFAMHVVLTAQDLYKKDTLPGKPNYCFAMALIFIVDVFLMAILMGMAGKGFSFVDFFQKLGNASAHIYWAVFKQLFGA